MPLVEQRVAGVVKQALDVYFSTYNFYPWADSLGVPVSYGSDYGLNRGWLPDNTYIDPSPDPITPNWVPGSLPAWFLPNQWYSLIYYSAARDKLVKGSDCTSCVSGKLTVDANNNVQALFFMPGTPIGTLTRVHYKLDDYLEDLVNNQHDAVTNSSPPPPSVTASATPPNDTYITPTSQNIDRDRVYYISGGNWNH
jgi:hypothetical protein